MDASGSSLDTITDAGLVSSHLAAKPVELWHRQMLVFSVTATLALAVELGYARFLPKLPPLYASLIRAATWDCVLVGVLAAQMVDLASIPFLKGAECSHYLPLAVILYHAMKMVFCAGYDILNSPGSGIRARSWHRSLVSRRVLLELAGGRNGGKLYLGRVCFVVSGAFMWLPVRALLWLDDGITVLTCFVMLLFIAYCAAGLAALELRHSLPGHIVQWLCTGWGTRGAILQGPFKVFGGVFLLPFAASVIVAQIWLRTLAFLVWLAMACPCCRLQKADNVYDAFERELGMPLLQCSFLAFACTLSAILLNSDQLSGMQHVAVLVAATYYTAMLMLWTAPSVMHAKVVAEESFEAAMLIGGDKDGAELLRSTLSGQPDTQNDEIELEDLRTTCEELRALLQRERHDHSVEMGQLQAKLRDQERQTRTAERERVQAAELASRFSRDLEGLRERCTELSAKPVPPQLPRLLWPSATSEPAGSQGGQPLKQHEDTARPDPSCASSSGDDGSSSDAEGSQLVQPDSHMPGSDLIKVDQPPAMGGSEAAVTCSGDAELTGASHEQQLVEVQREPQESPLAVPSAGSQEEIAAAAAAAAAADEDEQGGSPVLDACDPDYSARLHIEVPPPPPPPPQHEAPASDTTEDGDFGTPRSEQPPPPPESKSDAADDINATEAEAAHSTSSGEDDALLMGEPALQE